MDWKCLCYTRHIPAAGSRWHFRRVPGHLMMIGYWVSCGSVETRLLYCRTRSEGSLYPGRFCKEHEKQKEYRWIWILITAVHMWSSITLLKHPLDDSEKMMSLPRTLELFFLYSLSSLFRSCTCINLNFHYWPYIQKNTIQSEKNDFRMMCI